MGSGKIYKEKSIMRVHFIAVGGAAMHNLAIALHLKGFEVTGSDDAVYEPSRSRLAKNQLLPTENGWHPEKITTNIDAIILGMHAREDNPELLKAQELNISIFSYPEYIYQQSIHKKRIVIGGSHGKTTITSMILHVLNFHGKAFDYLVGAQIEGFDNMVKLSDAPVIIIEGDEYLASPLDRRPKFHLYKAHVGVISGVAWDHVNVFPSFENYKEQFEKFIDTIEADGTLIYCEEDEVLDELVKTHALKKALRKIAYGTPPFHIELGKTKLILQNDVELTLNIFGRHNLMNLAAARLCCLEADISDAEFYQAIVSFKGAAKRLEKLAETDNVVVFKDFAHSPSKLKATIDAVKEQFPNRPLIACIELHTFSSLDANFLKEYKHTMNGADFAIVYIDKKTFKQKKIKPFSKLDVLQSFDDERLKFCDNADELKSYLNTLQLPECSVLMMSSGTFGGIDLVTLANSFL